MRKMGCRREREGALLQCDKPTLCTTQSRRYLLLLLIDYGFLPPLASVDSRLKPRRTKMIIALLVGGASCCYPEGGSGLARPPLHKFSPPPNGSLFRLFGNQSKTLSVLYTLDLN